MQSIRRPPQIDNFITSPVGVGATLTQEQIEQIAQTFYSRFMQTNEMPDWKSAFAVDIRKTAISLVKKVVDSMVINSYNFTQLGSSTDEPS